MIMPKSRRSQRVVLVVTTILALVVNLLAPDCPYKFIVYIIATVGVLGSLFQLVRDLQQGQ